MLSRACFTNASWREKERILQRWADLACDVMLWGQPWSSLRVLWAARDPLRGSASSMCKTELLCFTSLAGRAAFCGDRRGNRRGRKTRGFPVFTLCGGRATLRGDCACQIALAMVPCESSWSARDCLQGSGCEVATLKCKSSTGSTSPQLRLQSRKVDSQMHRGTRRQSAKA